MYHTSLIKLQLRLHQSHTKNVVKRSQIEGVEEDGGRQSDGCQGQNVGMHV